MSVRGVVDAFGQDKDLAAVGTGVISAPGLQVSVVEDPSGLNVVGAVHFFHDSETIRVPYKIFYYNK